MLRKYYILRDTCKIRWDGDQDHKRCWNLEYTTINGVQSKSNVVSNQIQQRSILRGVIRDKRSSIEEYQYGGMVS